MSDPTLTDRQEEYLDALPAESYDTWGDAVGVAGTTAESAKERLNAKPGIDIQHVDGEWRNTGSFTLGDGGDSGGGDGNDTDSDNGPDPSDLTDRERYVARQLQQGATLAELTDDLDERESVVRQHFADIEAQGWDIYHDEDAGLYELANDGALRSSEHTGTRTRKANEWWETRNNALEREWRRVDPVDVDLAHTPGGEDWVTHVTDLHAGDRVRDYDRDVVYSTDDIPDIVEYITRQSITLADHHDADYDTAHLLWGGDMVTNEGIYEGQFEDLDAWLDEQADTVQDALIEQALTFADHFDTVNIVAQVGNHGDMRASGTSKQANADLLVYKAIRTFIAKSQQFWDKLPNVRIRVGGARAYTPVALRGGELHGHLRHGHHRKPQAETSARHKEWLSTLLDTAQSSWGAFDITWMGHHHISGRIPWNGPPILVSGSPKPAGEYVEELGVKGAGGFGNREIAHCHGVSDHGVTGIYPIDDRYYSR